MIRGGDFKQAVMAGVLGMFITAAVFALILTYGVYLPTISDFTVHRSDAEVIQYSRHIATVAFLISGASGLVLGFCVPPLFRIYRDRYFGRTTYPSSGANAASPRRSL